MESTFGAGLGGGNSHILLPLSQHASNTLLSMGRMHPRSALKISPFCHEHPNGTHEVRCWSLDTPGSASASSLPVNCSMFDGVTIVKCDCHESEILNLLSNTSDTRRRLGEAIHRIMKLTTLPETKHLRASWKRCRPTPNGTPQSLCSAFVTSGVDTKEMRVAFVNSQESVPLIDSEHWIPELSPEGFIGLYHNWDHNNGPSLYMICQSYLPKACLEFAEMVRNIGDACTASDVYHSEEAHWLRQACARNRARLIASVCQQMKIRFPAMLDYNACKTAFDSSLSWMQRRTLLAIGTVETLHHNMLSIPVKSMTSNHQEELIRVLNFCASSSSDAQNKTISTACVMAPWDGVWIFRNLHHSDHHEGKEFYPTIAPRIAEQDHIALKKKKMSPPLVASNSHPSFFTFSSKIPETSEILNIFYLKKEKSVSKKRSASTKKVQSSAPNQAVQDILSGIEEMQVVLPSSIECQNMEALKQMMLLDSEAPTDDHSAFGGDTDVNRAYQRSISKMTSMILLNDQRSSSGATEAEQGPKRNTYLSFDENVLHAMERHGWKRSKQYHTVLMPLGCGLCEHWKQFNQVQQVLEEESTQ